MLGIPPAGACSLTPCSCVRESCVLDLTAPCSPRPLRCCDSRTPAPKSGSAPSAPAGDPRVFGLPLGPDQGHFATVRQALSVSSHESESKKNGVGAKDVLLLARASGDCKWPRPYWWPMANGRCLWPGKVRETEASSTRLARAIFGNKPANLFYCHSAKPVRPSGSEKDDAWDDVAARQDPTLLPLIGLWPH